MDLCFGIQIRASSSLRKKVFEVSGSATMIQDPSARRTKDSQPSGFGFEYCASPVRFRVFSKLLVLLCHKFGCLLRAAQHGQRESVVARAATNLRRIVAIEFGTWRSGRNGASSGLVAFT